jgi:hypothetical protein
MGDCLIAILLGAAKGDARALLVEGVIRTEEGSVLVVCDPGGMRHYRIMRRDEAFLLPAGTLPIQISAVEGFA